MALDRAGEETFPEVNAFIRFFE
ncbi:hypothetical protein TNIN_187521, partial [Trichonephila inaurata madagascariensis]